MEIDPKIYIDTGLTADDFDDIEGRHKQIFRKLTPMINCLLEMDYSRKAIWDFLRRKKGLTMSYPHFNRYVNGKYARTRVRKIVEDRSPNHNQKVGQPRFEIPKVSSDEDRKKPAQGGFVHNPKAKSLREYAYGKDPNETKE